MESESHKDICEEHDSKTKKKMLNDNNAQTHNLCVLDITLDQRRIG